MTRYLDVVPEDISLAMAAVADGAAGDHRAVGVAALDAPRGDTGNRWIHPDRLVATTTEEFVDGWEPARDAFGEERARQWWSVEAFVSADAVAGTARTWGTWRVTA